MRTVWIKIIIGYLLGQSVHAAQSDIELKVQLQWYHQSQFAGVYLAQERKHFERAGLNVSLHERTTGIDPIKEIQDGNADIAITNLNNAWNLSLTGPQVVNVAQIFGASALALTCRKSLGVLRLSDIAGKKVGIWGVGDDNLVREILASIDISASQVELVNQAPNGEDLVAGRVHCATTMSYNEHLSIINAGIPDSDLLVIRPEQMDLANIEDGIYVKADRLTDPAFFDALVRFIAAVRLGWEDARIAPSLAVEAVLRRNTTLNRQFQRQMLESVLLLVPSAKERFGLLDQVLLEQQVRQIQRSDDRGLDSDRLWTYRVMNELHRRDGLSKTYSPSTLFYIEQFVTHRVFQYLVFFGVFVYALTGLLEAINRGYDIWGRLVLAMLSGVGGGTLRDLIIGLERQPFYYVADITYPLGILSVVLLVSALVWWFPNLPSTKGFKVVKSYSDMLGFSFLAITGAVIAISANMPWFWAPICAALTCAGGGMLRDIVINREPLTFRGVVYEEVAVVGGLFVVAGLFLANAYEHEPLPVWLSVSGGILVVFVLKWFIHHYGWRYPVREAITPDPAS